MGADTALNPITTQLSQESFEPSLLPVWARKGRVAGGGVCTPVFSLAGYTSMRHVLVFSGVGKGRRVQPSGAFAAISTWKEILLVAWKHSPGTSMMTACMTQPPKDRAREDWSTSQEHRLPKLHGTAHK